MAWEYGAAGLGAFGVLIMQSFDSFLTDCLVNPCKHMTRARSRGHQ